MILNGNALHIPLKDNSVQCVVTSPPYYGLRDYGVNGQIGMEPSIEEYVDNIVHVFREVWRVLRRDGTCWINLGDSYTSGGRDSHGTRCGYKQQSNRGTMEATGRRLPIPTGLKPKDLCGVPWRVAFALQSDGWYLRSEIIWHKPNPMPESVTDRPTKSHEQVFLLTKSRTYFYNAEAVKENGVGTEYDKTKRKAGRLTGTRYITEGVGQKETGDTFGIGSATRNRRSVWTIPSYPYKGAHFATYPEKLVEPCILAGSKPGDIVLDPFAGSCTTGVVSERYGREFVGIELSMDYIKLGKERMYGNQMRLAA